MRGTWRSDIYGLKRLGVGDVIIIETKNRSLYSYLRNRGDVLCMTLKGKRLGERLWQVMRVE